MSSISALGTETQTNIGVSGFLNMTEARIFYPHEVVGVLYTYPWCVGWGVLISVILLLLLNYMRDYYRFHYQDRFGSRDGTELTKPSELPPLYPSFIPFFGSAISFAWDNAAFIRRVA
jgi:hypothetical protein